MVHNAYGSHSALFDALLDIDTISKVVEWVLDFRLSTSLVLQCSFQTHTRSAKTRISYAYYPFINSAKRAAIRITPSFGVISVPFGEYETSS